MSSADDAEKKEKGRPSFQCSEAQRQQARDMAAAGHDDQAIADAIGVSLPTVRKHLAAEIDEGRRTAAPGLFDGAAPQPAVQPSAPVIVPAPAKPAGRPRFKATDRQRELVRMLSAAGIRQNTIAARIGVSEPTLRKVFRADLESAHELAKAAIVEQLNKQMLGGSTSAAEKLRTMIDEASLQAIDDRRKMLPAEKPASAAAETSGKKLQQAQAAEHAGKEGKWALLSARSVQ